ncbi:nose resistant to fluoxetine protein 6-like [Limulus polyphemus]|uniref:Nose resistant to fluoxetine protein 6-like n=1 Tax=Limulus polyphemus TaxID=6850 RepID=A0ABM1SEY1_LIMPO|nr:nose resistant to fluoxetine protein 6-like [Limulus polyphemus]
MKHVEMYVCLFNLLGISVVVTYDISKVSADYVFKLSDNEKTLVKNRFKDDDISTSSAQPHFLKDLTTVMIDSNMVSKTALSRSTQLLSHSGLKQQTQFFMTTSAGLLQNRRRPMLESLLLNNTGVSSSRVSIQLSKSRDVSRTSPSESISVSNPVIASTSELPTSVLKTREQPNQIVPLSNLFTNNNTPFPSLPTRLTSSTEDITRIWKDMNKEVRHLVNSLMKENLPTLIRYSYESQISSSCNSALLRLLFALRRLEPWAMELIDASGKLPDGVMRGTLAAFGSYDNCLEIKETISLERKSDIITGKYCTVKIRPPLPKKPKVIKNGDIIIDPGIFSEKSVTNILASRSFFFYFVWYRVGMCVPSACSREDVEGLVKSALKKSHLVVEVPNCEMKVAEPITTTQITIISLLSVVVILVVTGTSVDISSCWITDSGKQPKRGFATKALLCFSLVKNWNKLMDTRANQQMETLNGMKMFSMLWVILGHTYYFVELFSARDIYKSFFSMNNVPFQIILNAWLAVDTFFFLGGLVMTYGVLKKMKKSGGQLNLLIEILHRYLRLTPTILFVLGILFLEPLAASGPFWKEKIMKEVTNCQLNWWRILVYVINWTDYKDMCLPHLWYLSVDMQLFIPMLVVAWLLYKWPKMGLLLTCIIIVGSATAVGIITYLEDFYPTIVLLSPDQEFSKKIATYIYLRPYTHLGPYAVGVIVGYMLVNHGNVVLPRFAKLIGWMLSVSFNLAVLLLTYPWNNGTVPGVSVSVAYASIHRIIWATGLGWTSFMSVVDQANPVKMILSWKGFVPISRLSYSLYVVHLLVIWLRVWTFRERVVFHHYDLLYQFFGHLVVSIGAACVCYLLVEAPFASLECFLLSRWQSRVTEKPKCGQMMNEPSLKVLQETVVEDETVSTKRNIVVNNGNIQSSCGTYNNGQASSQNEGYDNYSFTSRL